MAESATSSLKEAVTGSPEVERLREELRAYVQARTAKTVAGLGTKLERGVGRLGESGAGALTGPLKAGGKALAEGKPPARALTSAGAAHMKNLLMNKVKGVVGKQGRKSGGGSRSVTIVEDIDVGVPVREAYDQWTQFQEFSTFAKGVVGVEHADDTTSNWTVKVARSTRSWRADVTEQVPDERISWTTEGAKGSAKGVVTFHPITEDLTRVLLVLEYFPHGLLEKTGNLWRAQGRRVRLDLKLYRKFIMMRGEATGSWRGEIRDGEVVVDHDQAVEQEKAEPDADGDVADEGFEDEGVEDVEDEDFADGDVEDEDMSADEAPEDAPDDVAEPEDAEPEDVEGEDLEPEDVEPEDAEPEEAEPVRRPRRRPAKARS